MKYDLDVSELDVLLMSLIGRRRTIKSLLETQSSYDPSYTAAYLSEMKVVESLIEKFFPGSLERIKAANAA